MTTIEIERIEPARLLRAMAAIVVVIVAVAWALASDAMAVKTFGVAGITTAACPNSSDEFGLDASCKGSPYTQAGGTPYEFTTKVELNSNIAELEHTRLLVPSGGSPKDIAVELPPGLVVDPLATPTCPIAVFSAKSSSCPASSQVGTVLLFKGGGFSSLAPLYNVTPEHGRPAEFGVATENGINLIIGGSVRTGEDYGLSALNAGIPEFAMLVSATVTLWGVPADPSHDPARGLICKWDTQFTGPPEATPACQGGGLTDGDRRVALVRMPTRCSDEPLISVAASDSWEAPGAISANGSRDHADPSWKTATGTMPPVTGCNLLSFESSLSVQPDSSLAGEPVGLNANLRVPQVDDPELTATPTVRSVRVKLPAGMVISPSAAQGLTTCRDDAEAKPAVEPNEFGPKSVDAASCAQSSQVGTVHVTSPDLPMPLDGHVFLGTPLCDPCSPADAQQGRMVRLYLEVVGEGGDGVTVKLEGTGSIDQQTGQVTTSFVEDPQLPFEYLTLSTTGGPRATLANSQRCGPATTTADLTPWTSPFTADSMPFSSYEVTGCAPAHFLPSFAAGTTSNQAGGFSPFVAAFGRSDADEFLNGASVKLPPGLLGMVSRVSLCGEPQASLGTCGSDSLIGHVQVQTGPGAEPYLVTGGSVFITGPYMGAPYGLSIVVPAKAGPYTLTGTSGTGTVVTRATVNVDPATAQLTVTSDPFPTELNGIPLQLRAVNITIERPEFTINPTNCNPLHLTASLASAGGRSAQVQSPFQATNCAALAFDPRFSVTTSGHTSRADGASLDAKLSYPAGSLGRQANIAAVRVELPKQLPSRLTTLQKACTDSVFNANPAACPSASRIGRAYAYTPVLPRPLGGPAYFVSHGGHGFPDLVVVLQGEGVTVDLVGTTFISKAGIISSTFKAVPDVPVGSFELVLPQGRYSALAANGDLCSLASGTVAGNAVTGNARPHAKARKRRMARLRMAISFTAQNGLVIKRTTVIRVSGCRKHSR
jgi:hypothetical protein